MTTTATDYTGTLFWPDNDSWCFRGGRRETEALWATLCNLSEQAAAAKRTTARELLAYKAAREAVYDLLAKDLAYSSQAERHGKRRLVIEARAILATRLERRTSRRRGELANDQQPGKVVTALLRLRELRRSNKRRRTRDLIEIAGCHAMFRRATGKWAGGEHSIDLSFIGDSSPDGVRTYETVFAKGGSTSARSSNGKWSGKNSHHRYIVPENWIETVHAVGIADVDDRVTLSAEPCDPKGAEAAWRVTVAQQSTGFDLKTAEGFVVMFAGQIHFAKSLSAARKKCANDWKPVFQTAR